MYILSRVPVLYRVTLCKNVISGLNNRTFIRNCTQFISRTNTAAEQRFKRMDNISNEYKLIYREEEIFRKLLAAVYHGAWLGLFSGILIEGYLIIKDPPVRERLESTTVWIKPLTKLSRQIILICSLITCVMMIVSCKMIPLRIYHNSSQKLYKVLFTNVIFGKKDMLTFSEGTVIPRFKHSEFMKDSLYNINNRTVLLDKECFPVPFLYEQMMYKGN